MISRDEVLRAVLAAATNALSPCWQRSRGKLSPAMRSTRAQELLFAPPEPPRASRARGVTPPSLKRRSRTRSWWWLLLVPAVTVPGALLRGLAAQNTNRDSPPPRGHWQDVLPTSPSPPLPSPLPPRPPPPHPLPPPPHRLAEPPAARTHATTATRRSSTQSSTKPHAGRQRQQPPQPEGRLRHPTPEGRLRHAQCTSPAQRAVKKLDRVPLLMSAAQAAKQSQFETETPQPTAGLALELLPGSSRLDANGGLIPTLTLTLILTLTLSLTLTLTLTLTLRLPLTLTLTPTPNQASASIRRVRWWAPLARCWRRSTAR